MDQKKVNNSGYWIAKGFISFFMLLSAGFTYFQPDGFQKLGFPAYFRIELVTAKIIGAFVLLWPSTTVRVKEWVYAGFIISMASGLIAHICSKDPLSKISFVSVDLILILFCINYVSQKDLSQTPLKKI